MKHTIEDFPRRNGIVNLLHVLDLCRQNKTMRWDSEFNLLCQTFLDSKPKHWHFRYSNFSAQSFHGMNDMRTSQSWHLNLIHSYLEVMRIHMKSTETSINYCLNYVLNLLLIMRIIRECDVAELCHLGDLIQAPYTVGWGI